MKTSLGLLQNLHHQILIPKLQIEQQNHPKVKYKKQTRNLADIGIIPLQSILKIGIFAN